MNYVLTQVDGEDLPVINLKVILNQFKSFAGSKMSIPAFTAAIVRICGKRVNGGAGYYVNRNDHMLQGYVKNVDAAPAVVVDAIGAAVVAVGGDNMEV
jgi:hypothetical protein